MVDQMGRPWILTDGEPTPRGRTWNVQCQTNIPGEMNTVATVTYKPMGELIVKAVNNHDELLLTVKRLMDCLAVDGVSEEFEWQYLDAEYLLNAIEG